MDTANFIALFVGGCVVLFLRLGDIAVKFVAKRLGVIEQEGAPSIADAAVKVSQDLKS